jgi:cell division protease FtsH
MMIDLIQRVRNTKNTLADVSKILKARFVGIDKQIDSILEHLTVWHAIPELIGRPVIINLWGMTGVGKTDLVRHLVKALKMTDRFVEIQMANKSPSNYTTIQNYLTNSSIEPDAPGILLLDEFQRFRTINPNGESFDHDFQDIWMLLSDGRFAGDSQAKSEIIELLFSDLFYQQFEHDDEDTSTEEKHKEKHKEKHQKYKQSIWSAKHLKRTLRLTEDVGDIMQWDRNKKYQMLQQALNDPATFEGHSYQQLLIFISGNLDEAFAMSDAVSESDTDADVFYDYSTRVNVITIKEALSQRFQPEQIARIGNTHVIYPSLNSASFREIIRRKIDEMVTRMKDFGLNITIDSSVHECIYRNGVFPAQGVRPVFSTINAILGNAVPEFALTALEHKQTAFTIRCQDDKLIANINQDEYRRVIEGCIDQIKKEHNVQEITLAAVHEAGHAVLYAVLFQLAPVQVIVNVSSNTKGGWVGLHTVSRTKESIHKQICVQLGGYVAEKLVFGDRWKTAGASTDLYTATLWMATAVREWGMNGTLSHVVNPNTHSEQLSYNLGDSDTQIEKSLRSQQTNAEQILKQHKPFFMAVIDLLLQHNTITPEQFKQLAKNHGISIDLLNPKEVIYEDFAHKLRLFCNNIA